MKAATFPLDTITHDPQTPVGTGAVSDDALLQPAAEIQAWKEAWRRVIDDKLIEWLIEKRPKALRGKLISAIWDDYESEQTVSKDVGWWTLRRVDEVCQKKLKSL